VTQPLRVGVFGAGAIGCFVGGRLAASGCDVTLVGRARVLDPIAANGLVLEDLESATRRVSSIRCATDASALRDCDVVIITTKTLGTRDAAMAVMNATRDDVPVISLQNGVEGPTMLRDVLGLRRGYGGMIAYNVVFKGATTLRRATSGPIVVERMHPNDEAVTQRAVPRLIEAMRAADLTTMESGEIDRVLWSKLLFNLNNALNALSGLPLRAQLRDRGYRRLMAMMMREGIAVMRARGMRPMRFGTLSPSIVSRALPVPNFVFERVAGAMLKIDPDARSSMAEDLAQRRPTEIDALNGVVVRMGEKHGVATPLNERVVRAVQAAEAANAGSPRLSAEQIARA
jgi:2-dehydropantoate 2-reductase